MIVGLPTTLGGEEGEQARLSRAFADELAELVDIPVETYDERLTTRMADRSAREGARADRDSLAAAHLLESYLGEGGGWDDRGARRLGRGHRGQPDPARRRWTEAPDRRVRARRPGFARAAGAGATSASSGAARRGKKKRKAAKPPKAPKARRAAAAPAESPAAAPPVQKAPRRSVRERFGRDGEAPRDHPRPTGGDLPPPPHPGARPGSRRRAGRLVPDRILPAAAVRSRQGIRRGDRQRARGRHRQRRLRPAPPKNDVVSNGDAVRMAPEAGRRHGQDPAGPLRPRPQHELLPWRSTS